MVYFYVVLCNQTTAPKAKLLLFFPFFPSFLSSSFENHNSKINRSILLLFVCLPKQTKKMTNKKNAWQCSQHSKGWNVFEKCYLVMSILEILILRKKKFFKLNFIVMTGKIFPLKDFYQFFFFFIFQFWSTKQQNNKNKTFRAFDHKMTKLKIWIFEIMKLFHNFWFLVSNFLKSHQMRRILLLLSRRHS